MGHRRNEILESSRPDDFQADNSIPLHGNLTTTEEHKSKSISNGIDGGEKQPYVLRPCENEIVIYSATFRGGRAQLNC